MLNAPSIIFRCQQELWLPNFKVVLEKWLPLSYFDRNIGVIIIYNIILTPPYLVFFNKGCDHLIAQQIAVKSLLDVRFIWKALMIVSWSCNLKDETHFKFWKHFIQQIWAMYDLNSIEIVIIGRFLYRKRFTCLVSTSSQKKHQTSSH